MTHNSYLVRIPAAQGWLALGMPLEAWDELEALPPADRARGDVLALRVDVMLALGRWSDAELIAAGLLKREPWRAEVVFARARALARLNRVTDAKECVQGVPQSRRDLWEEMLRCEDLGALWAS